LTSIDTVSLRPRAGVRVVASAVDVCICTYKRPDVVNALRTVAEQQGAEEISYRVIIADNAERPEAREMIVDAARRVGLEFLYIHAPAKNISIARNACLDAASAEWFSTTMNGRFRIGCAL
jgi:succinoglycan biosynthesis protein ExoM